MQPKQLATEYTRRKKRRPIPGLGEFDSGHTDTSERAEDILKKAALTRKWQPAKRILAHELGLADASVIAAVPLNLRRILTVDKRDFAGVQTSRGEHFELPP